MRWQAVFYLFMLATCAIAAERSSAASSKTEEQTNTSTSARPVSIEGCLSGGNGAYILTDVKGSSYRLTGAPAKLSAQVGREVVVTGTVSGPPSDTHSESSSATARSRSYSQIEVTTVRQIAKTCRNTLPH
jgi:hypothetical protein